MLGSSRVLRWSVVAAAVAVMAGGLTACGDGDSDPDSGKQGPKKNEPLKVDYEVPDGFAKNKDLKPLEPLAEDVDVSYYTMEDAGDSEAIFVASYVINVDTSNLKRDELIELVEQYDTKVDNKGKGVPYLALANGHEGLHKWTKQETDKKDEFITYDAEYFFKANHLVQVGCQYDKQQKAVSTACGSVLSSLDF